MRRTFLAAAIAVALIPAVSGAAQIGDPPRAVVGCDTCHDQPDGWRAKPFVHAPVELEDCLSCHNAHASRHGALLRRETERTCLSCHEDLAAKLGRESKHAALAGDRQCLACHDPHASDRAKLLRDEPAKLCATCHDEGAGGSGTVSHPPFASGECLSCHDPHSSSTPALTIAGEPELCTGCHALPDRSLETAHGGIAIARSRCSSCHAPHDSDRVGLIRPGVHPPFIEGCDTCHADPSAAPATLRDGALELCTTCHEPHSGGHAVPEGGACLNCHSPHASTGKALIAGRERDVCLTCHTDIAAQREAAEGFHPGAARSGDCTTCHELHTGKTKTLLKGIDPHRTCTECHATHAEFSHPMGIRVEDPTNPDRFLGCLSCHQPHGTPFRSFLLADPRRDLCVRCHADGQHDTAAGPVGDSQ